MSSPKGLPWAVAKYTLPRPSLTLHLITSSLPQCSGLNFPPGLGMGTAAAHFPHGAAEQEQEWLDRLMSQVMGDGDAALLAGEPVCLWNTLGPPAVVPWFHFQLTFP